MLLMMGYYGCCADDGRDNVEYVEDDIRVDFATGVDEWGMNGC